jgi:hypothetical protein
LDPVLDWFVDEESDLLVEEALGELDAGLETPGVVDEVAPAFIIHWPL